MIKFNWGKGMALVMVGFMAFIITMAVMMSKIDTNLVEKDYYEKGQNYDVIAEMKSNYRNTDSLLSIYQSTDNVFIKFGQSPDSGLVHFFRPSDKSADQKYRIAKHSEVVIEKSKLLKGLWKIRILFYRDGKGYFTEESLHI